jgi:uncharacterized protein (TIGR02594 family)
MANAVGAAARPDDPPWLECILADLGLRELPGAHDNPRIVAMFQTVGRPDVTDDETSWCAACVGHFLVKGGVARAALPPKAERLLARSYLKVGRRLDRLARGCVVILERGGSSWQGHVAFGLRCLVVDGRDHVEVIGGNRSNAITVARYPATKVLGYRWPTDCPLPGEGAPAPKTPVGGRATPTEQAAAGTIAAVGAGAIAAAGMGAPWWAILGGAGLGLSVAALLIFIHHKQG